MVQVVNEGTAREGNGVSWDIKLPSAIGGTCGRNGGLQVVEHTLDRKCTDLPIGRRRDA